MASRFMQAANFVLLKDGVQNQNVCKRNVEFYATVGFMIQHY